MRLFGALLAILPGCVGRDGLHIAILPGPLTDDDQTEGREVFRLVETKPRESHSWQPQRLRPAPALWLHMQRHPCGAN